MTQPNQKIARSFEDMKGGLDLLIGGLQLGISHLSL